MSKHSWLLSCLIYVLSHSVKGIILRNPQTNQEWHIVSDSFETDMTVNDLYSEAAKALNTTSTRFELSYSSNLIERSQGEIMLSELEPAPIPVRSEDGETEIDLCTFFIEKSEWIGGHGGHGQIGSGWDRFPSPITAIRAQSGVDIAGSLAVEINGDWERWGAQNQNGATTVTLNITDGEVINKVNVQHDGTYINYMEFFTNKGQKLMLGNTFHSRRGDPSRHYGGTFSATESGTELMGLWIKSGCWVDGVQFTWRNDALDSHSEPLRSEAYQTGARDTVVQRGSRRLKHKKCVVS